MALYVGGMFLYYAFFAYRTEALRLLGVALVAPGAAIHLAAIITRGFADGHYPLANMYEYSSMLALVAVTVFLLMPIPWPAASLGGGVALLTLARRLGRAGGDGPKKKPGARSPGSSTPSTCLPTACAPGADAAGR